MVTVKHCSSDPEGARMAGEKKSEAFDCVDHNKLRNILKEMRIPDHLTHFLRNLYVGQEATKPDME